MHYAVYSMTYEVWIWNNNLSPKSFSIVGQISIYFNHYSFLCPLVKRYSGYGLKSNGSIAFGLKSIIWERGGVYESLWFKYSLCEFQAHKKGKSPSKDTYDVWYYVKIYVASMQISSIKSSGNQPKKSTTFDSA